MTNLHHYRVEFFFVVIDIQLQELNERFNEVNTELLLCLASLCPGDSFVAFDKKKSWFDLLSIIPKTFLLLSL